MTVLAGQDQGGASLGRLGLQAGARLDQCANDHIVTVLGSFHQRGETVVLGELNICSSINQRLGALQMAILARKVQCRLAVGQSSVDVTLRLEQFPGDLLVMV